MKFQRDSNRAYLLVRDRIGATLSSLQEGLAGVRVIQAYGRERRQVDGFSAHERPDLYDAHMDSVRISAWYLPVIEGAGVLTTAATLAVGGWLVHDGQVTLGTVTFFVLTLSNLFEPLNQLSQLFNIVQSAGAGLKKLFDLLDTEPAVDEPADPVALPADGAVELVDGSFRVRRRVRSCSTTSPSGSSRASGWPSSVRPAPASRPSPSSSPASTTPSTVSVRVGGVDLRDVSLRRAAPPRVRRAPGRLPVRRFDPRQRPHRSRSTPPTPRSTPRSAAVGALDRFRALPEGLDTPVRERGSRLSAGEKQLVSLARAALADPEVLVLDEATSSLDPGTERLVEHALEVLMEGRTVIVIAHRLSTAERADRVAVVDGGRLVELGRHADLAVAGGPYSKLYATWSLSTAATR